MFKICKYINNASYFDAAVFGSGYIVEKPSLMFAIGNKHLHFKKRFNIISKYYKIRFKFIQCRLQDIYYCLSRFSNRDIFIINVCSSRYLYMDIDIYLLKEGKALSLLCCIIDRILTAVNLFFVVQRKYVSIVYNIRKHFKIFKLSIHIVFINIVFHGLSNLQEFIKRIKLLVDVSDIKCIYSDGNGIDLGVYHRIQLFRIPKDYIYCINDFKFVGRNMNYGISIMFHILSPINSLYISNLNEHYRCSNCHLSGVLSGVVCNNNNKLDISNRFVNISEQFLKLITQFNSHTLFGSIKWCINRFNSNFDDIYMVKDYVCLHVNRAHFKHYGLLCIKYDQFCLLDCQDFGSCQVFCVYYSLCMDPLSWIYYDLDLVHCNVFGNFDVTGLSKFIIKLFENGCVVHGNWGEKYYLCRFIINLKSVMTFPIYHNILYSFFLVSSIKCYMCFRSKLHMQIRSCTHKHIARGRYACFCLVCKDYIS